MFYRLYLDIVAILKHSNNLMSIHRWYLSNAIFNPRPTQVAFAITPEYNYACLPVFPTLIIFNWKSVIRPFKQKKRSSF